MISACAAPYTTLGAHWQVANFLVCIYAWDAMLNKHKSRELAMQALFLWDMPAEAGEPLTREMMSAFADADTCDDAMKQAKAAWDMREISDAWTQRIAPQWPPHRQPGVDRAILRLAVWELTTCREPKVVIDEAIELAKTYSTENSPAFVNGVLDAVLREKQTLTAEKSAPAVISDSTGTPGNIDVVSRSAAGQQLTTNN